jgi:hypothetical protein
MRGVRWEATEDDVVFTSTQIDEKNSLPNLEVDTTAFGKTFWFFPQYQRQPWPWLYGLPLFGAVSAMKTLPPEWKSRVRKPIPTSSAM